APSVGVASAQADFSVPFGSTFAIAPFCTRMRTLSAISTLTKCSPISRTTPATPPLVITSSPLPSFSSMARCSFCRFICGRIIRKYMIAIRMIGNSRPPRPPPNRPPGAWPAAWAIAGGTNRSIGFIWQVSGGENNGELCHADGVGRPVDGPGRMEGPPETGEGSRGDGRAHRRHQLLVVPEVVQGAQDRAQHLVAAVQVAQVGAAEAAGAGGAAAALLDRARVALELRVADADGAGRGEIVAVARVPGRHHAVEHVHAAGH